MRLPEIEIDQPRLMRNYDSLKNVNLNRSVEIGPKQPSLPLMRRKDPSDWMSKMLPRLPTDEPSLPSPR